MVLQDSVKSSFNICNKNLSILNIYAEFSLQGIVNIDGGGDIAISILTSPVGFESNRNSFPTSRIYLSESFADAFNNSLGSKTRLDMGKIFNFE